MKNSKLRRVLLLLACAVMLVSLSVGATLAYLQSQTETVVNTFTVGNVKIDLDEAKVNEDGQYVTNHDNRTKANDYKLQPNQTYIKDPTVTVKAKSEDCFVRILVTIDYKAGEDGAKPDALAKLKAAFPVVEGSDRNELYWENGFFNVHQFVNGWFNEEWQFQLKANQGLTYEFWYVGDYADDKDAVPYSTSDTVLEDLFDEIKMPSTLTNTELAELTGLQINVVAHAIQADGFDNAAAAWAAWDPANTGIN